MYDSTILKVIEVLENMGYKTNEINKRLVAVIIAQAIIFCLAAIIAIGMYMSWAYSYDEVTQESKQEISKDKIQQESSQKFK